MTALARLLLGAVGGSTLAQSSQAGDQARLPRELAAARQAAVAVPPGPTNVSVPYFDFETIQLTSGVVANLSSLGLKVSQLFDFAKSSPDRHHLPQCKAFPGTPEWPAEDIWKVFNETLGGTLIQNTPLAAPCFDSWPALESNATCSIIQQKWNTSRFQIDNSAGTIFPLFENRTCMPTAAPNGSCTLGAIPTYMVNVSSVAQVQLAINFARNTNLRLTIKNKGHDVNGKSYGAGSLGIYTNWLRDIRFIPSYSSGNYSGPAYKVGTGVEVEMLYKEADSRNLSVVGGICKTVGLAGGYSQGGGHSLLMSLYGMGADQVLGMEVVLPDGRFVTVDSNNYPDLYWAIRGGGGSTFGVVTSAIVAAHPRLPVATLNYTMTTAGTNKTAEAWWAALRAFWATYTPNADAGHFLYHSVICNSAPPANCTLSVKPHWANNMTVSQLRAHVAPLFVTWAKLGLNVTDPVFAEYPSLYTAFEATFPDTGAGGTVTHTASRLFPRRGFIAGQPFEETAAGLQKGLELNRRMLAFNYKRGNLADLDTNNAVNPPWRDAVLFAMMANPWPEGSSTDTIVEHSRMLVKNLQPWRDVTPGGGSYNNEGDVNEPDPTQAFYGDNYAKLYELKQRYDPWGVLFAQTAVGAEDWSVTGQIPFYPSQNGRLCRK